jgi:next-to-BRCA1 protein 1
MAPYVLKIKYGDVLRRVTVESSLLGNAPDMTFSQLEETIRQAFKIPATSDLVITYNDKDNDVVTMAGDQDLHDALVFQGLNPLRLTVVAQESQRPAHHGRHGGRWGHGHGHGRGPQPQPQPDLQDLKSFFGNSLKMSQDTAKQTVDYAQQLLQACEPLIKGAPSMVVSEVKDAIMKLASSAQLGAAPGATSSSQPGATSSHAEEHFQAPGHFGHHMPPPPGHFGVPPPPHVPFPEFSPFPHFPPPPFLWGESPAPAPVGCNGDKADQATPAASQDGKDPVQHRGVQCDVCGMCPIIGTRYKSIKKHDYDLCQKCFEQNGTTEDYTKIDKPLWRPRHFNQFSGGRMRCPAMSSYYGGRPSFSMRGPHMHGSHGPHGFHGPYAGKGDSRCGGAFGGKLDARFVQDVTIFDGTEFAPGTEFTKIWRLRNSGSCAWPKSTQLVHVGGDALGSVLAVDLVLPEEGLAPDGEAEVSVDLVAPEKPGRYVSHWRLVSPTGQKFGHRVWVLIQVVPSDEQSPQMIESLLASSQEDIEMPQQEAAETATPQPMEDEAVVDPFPAADVDTLEPVAASKEAAAPETVQYPEINMEALTLDAVVVDTGKTQEENTAVENSELGNFSMVNMPTVTEIPVEQVEDTVSPPRVAFAVDDEPAEMKKAAEADSLEMTLGALESMGFKQRDLNQELLKKNDYDLQRTVDDLVMAAEWDPMLEELEEMGFYDTDMNRRLMFKNNGSVKRVVKELVQMYKDPKGKEQI